MRRRGFVKALAAVPAAPVLLAQQPAAQPAPAQPPAPSDEIPALTASVPDVAADMMPRYFTPGQFSTLRRVSDLLLPPMNGAAGAIDAKAPEFLDFLISESPAERQTLYRNGLDALNQQAQQKFQKPFADLDATQADTLLSPLKQPWTFDEPTDPVAAFLRAAKQDVRIATTNSREYSSAAPARGGRRGFGGAGLYWYPLD